MDSFLRQFSSQDEVDASYVAHHEGMLPKGNVSLAKWAHRLPNAP